MTTKTTGLDQLTIEDGRVIFTKATGESMDMPNLTKIVALYEAHKADEIGARAKEVLDRGMGALLITEVMMDMTNDKTNERFENGEISKTMRHVNTYNIVLESHLEKAIAGFEGDFETCKFAEFPYGIVIEREKYPTYKNTDYCIDAIRKVIEA